MNKIKLFLTYLLVNWFPTAALTRLSTLFFTISMAPDSRLSLIPLENGTLGVKKVDTESAALTLKAAYYI